MPLGLLQHVNKILAACRECDAALSEIDELVHSFEGFLLTAGRLLAAVLYAFRRSYSDVQVINLCDADGSAASLANRRADGGQERIDAKHLVTRKRLGFIPPTGPALRV